MPFEVSGRKFVRLQILGQSFMLHQIRKMVGLALAVMRGIVDVQAIPNALTQNRAVVVPTAPELGLFLVECLFHSYNKAYREHADLALSEFKDEVEAFKLEHIYPHMAYAETSPYTLQPAPYMLYTAPYTIPHTPYTLHPE
mmetsp:Transcript_2343/g.8201  ORF Transcript_2343/g.8201 Transcript_2343/m.8201 type:complete len:141 (+) Transcript_2343:462-884(+)